MSKKCENPECDRTDGIGLCRDHTWQVVHDQDWPGWAHVVLEHLRTEPFPRLACNKANVADRTYRRLRQKSPEFAEAAEIAIGQGASHVLNLEETRGGKSKALWVLNRLPIDDFRDPEKRLDREAQDQENELRQLVDYYHDLIVRHGGPALQELRDAVDQEAARLLSDS